MTALESILTNIFIIGFGIFDIYMILKLIAYTITRYNIWKYGCWWGKMPEWLENIVDYLA